MIRNPRLIGGGGDKGVVDADSLSTKSLRIMAFSSDIADLLRDTDLERVAMVATAVGSGV